MMSSTANKADTLDAPIASLTSIAHPWRHASDAHRSPTSSIA
jgi:hypothetical protein